MNSIKIKSLYRILESKEPKDKETHVLWYESETTRGINYQRVFKGTKEECERVKKEKENVPKPKVSSFKLFRRKSYNR